MPRANVNTYKKQIATELQKWKARSRQMKTSSHISYGKIKTSLHALEVIATKEELNSISSDIGKIRFLRKK